MKKFFSASVFLFLSISVFSQQQVSACFQSKGEGNAMHFYEDPDKESTALVANRSTMRFDLEDYFLYFLESYSEKGKDDTTFFATIHGSYGYQPIKTEIKACFTGEVLEERGDSILVKKLSKDTMRLGVNAEIFEIQPLAEKIYADNEFLFENDKRKEKDVKQLIEQFACNTVFFYNGKDVWNSKLISPCENEFICSCKDGIEDEQWYHKSKWKKIENAD